MDESERIRLRFVRFVFSRSSLYFRCATSSRWVCFLRFSVVSACADCSCWRSPMVQLCADRSCWSSVSVLPIWSCALLVSCWIDSTVVSTTNEAKRSCFDRLSARSSALAARCSALVARCSAAPRRLRCLCSDSATQAFAFACTSRTRSSAIRRHEPWHHQPFFSLSLPRLGYRHLWNGLKETQIAVLFIDNDGCVMHRIMTW